MNKRLSLLTAALLLTGASSAFAASSTDLTVTGIITPAACTPTLASGGIVNYGKIPVKDLYSNKHTNLPLQSIQLTVNCDASTPFALIPIDNKKDTASVETQYNFGLGLTPANEKLGVYNLSFRNPVADTPVTAIYTHDEGETWSVAPVWSRNAWAAFGSQTGGTWAPDSLQNVTVNIDVNTHIAPTNGLTLTDDVTLDGSATLQIEYL